MLPPVCPYEADHDGEACTCEIEQEEAEERELRQQREEEGLCGECGEPVFLLGGDDDGSYCPCCDPDDDDDDDDGPLLVGECLCCERLYEDYPGRDPEDELCLECVEMGARDDEEAAAAGCR